MELKIIDFIKTHSNWEELLTSSPYNLTIKRDGKLILFKYNQIDSDFKEEICCEARGLILEEGTWKIVRFAFKKFFNLGESFAAKIDWDSAVGSEKLDGSIISVFFYDGEWRIATNSTINAFKAPLAGESPYQTFGQLFESVLPLCVFKGNRWENLCFTFELVSPFNRIVIEYPETEIYLLSVRRMDTLEEEKEFGALRRIAASVGAKRPKVYQLTNQKDYEELVASMDDSHEGIVVCDDKFNRVKIKTLHYFELHRMAHNGNVPLETIVDLVRTNETEEFLAYFSQYRYAVEEIQKRVEAVYKAVEQVVSDVADWEKENLMTDYRARRKEFALWVREQAYPSMLYFKAYQEEDIVEYVNQMPNAAFIRTFNIN